MQSTLLQNKLMSIAAANFPLHLWILWTGTAQHRHMMSM